MFCVFFLASLRLPQCGLAGLAVWCGVFGFEVASPAHCSRRLCTLRVLFLIRNTSTRKHQDCLSVRLSLNIDKLYRCHRAEGAKITTGLWSKEAQVGHPYLRRRDGENRQILIYDSLR